MDVGLSRLREPREGRIGALDRRRHHQPWLPLDRGAIHAHHPGERLIRPDDDVVLVQFDEAVDGGVEHEPQVLLGAPDRLVRFPDPFEREIRFAERRLPPYERLFDGLVGLGAGDLVRHDAGGDAPAQEHDQQRGLERPDRFRVAEDGHARERAAGRDDGHAAEDRAGEAQLRPRDGNAVGDQGEDGRQQQRADDVDRVHPRVARSTAASCPHPSEQHRCDRITREREELQQVRDGRDPQGQCSEAGELGCGQDRDHACDPRLGRSGTGWADQQVQDRADGRRDQHHVDRDLAPVSRVEMDPELVAHRDREREQQEGISRSGVVGRVGCAPDGQEGERNRRDKEQRPCDPRSARPRVLVS